MKVSIKNLFKQRNKIADFYLKHYSDKYFEKLRDECKNNFDVFFEIFTNYNSLKNYTDFSCIELDNITRKQLAPWYVWFLKKYILKNNKHQSILDVINLYQNLIDNKDVSDAEWDITRNNARQAVREASDDKSRYCAWVVTAAAANIPYPLDFDIYMATGNYKCSITILRKLYKLLNTK